MDASAGASGGGGLMDMLGGMDPAAMEQQTGMTVLRPGDASVAAPFTSKVPSVRAVVDLIRQGRCTLLSALMQQQIMMLESIIAAYTLSALSLHNARSSERQMMASSWLIMTAAVAFSYASPLDKMHPLRPLRSLFHPAIFLSILGQVRLRARYVDIQPYVHGYDHISGSLQALLHIARLHDKYTCIYT